MSDLKGKGLPLPLGSIITYTSATHLRVGNVHRVMDKLVFISNYTLVSHFFIFLTLTVNNVLFTLICFCDICKMSISIQKKNKRTS